MKVTVINSSPRRKCGNTSQILLPFMDALREQGAEVKLFYTQTEQIRYCKGEYACWYKHPGTCCIHDNMKKMLGSIQESDILVLASPIYAVGMNGQLKTVLDRLLPLSKPFVEVRDGRMCLTFHDDIKLKKIVLVSSCGFWNMENFDTIIDEVASFCQKINVEFAGKLLRPSGDFFRLKVKEKSHTVDDILNAAARAGSELLVTGAISEETEQAVSKHIMTIEECAAAFNAYADLRWQEIEESLESEFQRVAP